MNLQTLRSLWTELASLVVALKKLEPLVKVVVASDFQAFKPADGVLTEDQFRAIHALCMEDEKHSVNGVMGFPLMKLASVCFTREGEELLANSELQIGGKPATRALLAGLLNDYGIRWCRYSEPGAFHGVCVAFRYFCNGKGETAIRQYMPSDYEFEKLDYDTYKKAHSAWLNRPKSKKTRSVSASAITDIEL